MSESRMGYKWSDEVKKKMRLAKLGKKQSKEHIKKRAEARNQAAILRGYFHSPITRSRISSSNMGRLGSRGRKSNWWKGGITQLQKNIRKSWEYIHWRDSCFARDNYTCQECGICNGKGKTVVLHVHHIKSFALYPESRFDLKNGVTLCIECHKKTDTYAGRGNYKK